MFTQKQRFDILKYGSLTLIALVCLASLSHGLFFIMLFQYYIPALIIGFAIYFAYTKAKTLNLTDDQIKEFFQTKFTTFFKK